MKPVRELGGNRPSGCGRGERANRGEEGVKGVKGPSGEWTGWGMDQVRGESDGCVDQVSG